MQASMALNFLNTGVASLTVLSHRHSNGLKAAFKEILLLDNPAIHPYL
jgi:hypothetical protein